MLFSTVPFPYNVLAFIGACAIVFVGILVIDFFRALARKKKAREKIQPVMTTPTPRDGLKRMQDSRDDYNRNKDEINRRIDREDKERFAWALQNPADPVAFRHLTEIRDNLAKEAGYLEHFRVPVMGDPSPHRDQRLADLIGLEERIAEIDDVLPQSADSQ